MLSQLVTYGKFGTLFCGIEHSTINGKDGLHGLLLKKKKAEFLIEKTFESETVGELSTHLNKSQHLFLIVNNAQVLSKTLNGAYESQKALAQAFPNLNHKDFYSEVYTVKATTFIAICRKDVIDPIIDEYAKSGFSVLGFSLGNLVISQLKNLNSEAVLTTSNSKITFNNEEIVAMESANVNETFEYDINGLSLTNYTLLPLAGILNYYTKQQTTETNFSATVENLKEDFKQKRIFEFGLKGILSTVFILLLISFLYFTGYSSKIETITAELDINKNYKTTLVNLTDEISKKERLVNDFSLTSSRASWYLDQIGNSVPTSVLLYEIQYQPLVKNIKVDVQVSVSENSLIIKGNSNDSKNFSEWIKTLENQEWIDNISIQDYGTGKNTTTGFELKIEIKA